MLKRGLLHLLINALAVWATVYLVPGIEVLPDGPQWAAIVVFALILGLINALLRPLLKLLTLPVLILTLGLFSLLINTLTFWLAAMVGEYLHVGFYVRGFWAAFLGALVVSVVSSVLSLLFQPDRHPHSKPRLRPRSDHSRRH